MLMFDLSLNIIFMFASMDFYFAPLITLAEAHGTNHCDQ
jgi:hypothetical protein